MKGKGGPKKAVGFARSDVSPADIGANGAGYNAPRRLASGARLPYAALSRPPRRLLRRSFPLPLAAFLALLLLATAPAPAPPGSALERFFVGATEGSGTVKVVLSGSHGMRDRSRGRLDKDGALLLDQVVEEEGKPPRRRSWRLIRTGGNRVTGTISDVSGAVAGELGGDSLHLRYRMADGPTVEQWIALQPGGRTATNRMVFRKFGLKVATVQSTIRKVE